MKVTVILGFLALCGTVKLSSGTTCTQATAMTCAKTLFVTGTCTNGACACTAGYVAGPYGCQKKQMAVMTTGVTGFNGEVVKDSKVTLSCSGDSGSEYIWLKDGAVLDGKKTNTLDLTFGDNTNSGTYKCRAMISGILSEDSNAIILTYVESPTKNPTVTGMPTKAFEGMKATLSCENVAIPVGEFGWEVEGTLESEKTQTYIYTIKVNEKVTCARGAIKSQPMTAPASFDPITTAKIDVPRMKLITGEKITATCKVVGVSAYVPSEGLTYTWKKDGKDLPPKTATYDIEESGAYTCMITAVLGAASATSPSVSITAGTSMGKDQVELVPSTPGSTIYNAVHCLYKTIDTSIPVTYAWKEGGNVLLGVTDKTLQMNEFGTSAKTLSCSVTSDAGTVENDQVSFKPIAFSVDDAKPTLTKVGVDGVGNEIIFTCKSPMFTPGGEYKWYVANTAQAEKSNTFKFRPADMKSVAITCSFSFGGVESTKSDAKTITAKKIFGVAITVRDHVASSTLKPVKTTKVKLTCAESKSAGAGAVTYTWTKDSSVTTTTTKEYELVAGDASVTIKCTAKAGDDTMDSSQLSITPQDNPEKPKISDGTVYLGGKAQLRCVSESYAEGATFEWKKDGTVISGTSIIYEISSASTATDGSYSCTMTVGGKTSAPSDPKVIKAKANEKKCTYARDCIGDNFDSTVCKDEKCKCKSGFFLESAMCITSDAGTLVTSLLLTMAAFLFQRLV